MPTKKYKTTEYTRRAIDNYRKSHKTLQIVFSLDELERMTAAGMTSRDIKPLVMAEIERREKMTEQPRENEDQETAETTPPDFVPPFN